MSRGRATGHGRSFYRDGSRKFCSSTSCQETYEVFIRQWRNRTQFQKALEASSNKHPIDRRDQRRGLQMDLK